MVDSPFRGESLWKPTIPEMAWLFPAYAIDGTEPPIAHRHHISTQNQRHRSIVPRQHIQHRDSNIKARSSTSKSSIITTFNKDTSFWTSFHRKK